MVRYSISAESVEALRILKNRLQNFTDEIIDAAFDLKNVVFEIEEELGIYATEILQLAENNVRTMRKNNDSLIILATMMDKKATDMQVILNDFSLPNDYIYNPGTQNKSQQSYGKFENKIFGAGNLLKKYEDIFWDHAFGKTSRRLEVIKNYTGTFYAKINKYLDDMDEWSVSVQNSIKENIDVLTDTVEMNELPQQQVMLYGGINVKEIFGSDLEVLQFDELISRYQRKEQHSKRFLSTSCKKNKAEQINGAVISFRAPKGTKGLFLGKLPSFGIEEAEVLLQRGMIQNREY